MTKIKELLNSRTKKIIVAIVILSVVGTSFGIYALTQNKTYLKLKKENIIIEYGQQLPAAIEDYLDVKGFDKNELKKIKLTTDVKNENDKEFPAIGTYKVELTYKKEKVSVDVEVKDTTKPTFEVFNDVVKIEVNANDVNLESYYKTNDLSSVNVTVDGSIDLGVVGTYEVKVAATDSSANKETKNAIIEIVTLEQAYAGDVTTNVNGVIPVSDELTAKRAAEDEARRLAEEARIKAEKEKSKTGTNGTSNGSGNTGTTTSGGSGNTGNTNSNSNQQTHTHSKESYNNMWFVNELAADEYAYQQSSDKTSPAFNKGWRFIYCSCGLIGIQFKN